MHSTSNSRGVGVIISRKQISFGIDEIVIAYSNHTFNRTNSEFFGEEVIGIYKTDLDRIYHDSDDLRSAMSYGESIVRSEDADDIRASLDLSVFNEKEREGEDKGKIEESLGL